MAPPPKVAESNCVASGCHRLVVETEYLAGFLLWLVGLAIGFGLFSMDATWLIWVLFPGDRSILLLKFITWI